MASAVWSMSSEAIHAFPALTLIRFFDNHGMLGINTHPQWKTVRGGSHQYVAPITRPYRDRVRMGSQIAGVARSANGVEIRFRNRAPERFDHVVFACHGDQVLPLLESPTDREREILGSFATTRNIATLHTDSRLLPRRPRARASWNYNLGMSGGDRVAVTYHMNRLQSLPAGEDYCVTLNGESEIDPHRRIRSMTYEHPLYTRAAIAAQSRWAEISGGNRTHYCGAYWMYGFHEDGLNSALRVARAMGVPC
jgi:predicted NAD/FAD-binding protein